MRFPFLDLFFKNENFGQFSLCRYGTLDVDSKWELYISLVTLLSRCHFSRQPVLSRMHPEWFEMDSCHDNYANSNNWIEQYLLVFE